MSDNVERDIVERLRRDYSYNSDAQTVELDPEVLREAADEIERLRATVIDAREMVDDWAGYASDYFQEKWDLASDLAKLDAIIGSFPDAPVEAS